MSIVELKEKDVKWKTYKVQKGWYASSAEYIFLAGHPPIAGAPASGCYQEAYRHHLQTRLDHVESFQNQKQLDGLSNGLKLGRMTRYLTPWRTCLLCLIKVYTDGLVPNSSAVDVLSFLTAGLFPLDPADKQWEKHYLPRITDIEEALSGLESSVPGRSVWDLFLKKIWSLDSLDALEVFYIDEIPSLLTKTREQLIADRDNGLAPENERMRLSRSSPLGAFVRRAYLEYARLQFHDSVMLWSAFVKYRLPTYHMWTRRNAADKQAPIDINLPLDEAQFSAHLAHVVYGNIENGEEDEGSVSVKDADRLIEFQVAELQSTFV